MKLARLAAIAAIVCVFALTTAQAGGLETCNITFSLEAREPTTIVQFRIDYSAVQGAFSILEHVETDEDGVAMVFKKPKCTSLISNVAPMVNLTCSGLYDECQWGEGRELSAIIALESPVSGAIPLLRCEFQAGEVPEATDIIAVIEDATSPQDERYAMEDTAAMSVSEIACSSASN